MRKLLSLFALVLVACSATPEQQDVAAPSFSAADNGAGNALRSLFPQLDAIGYDTVALVRVVDAYPEIRGQLISALRRGAYLAPADNAPDSVKALFDGLYKP